MKDHYATALADLAAISKAEAERGQLEGRAAKKTNGGTAKRGKWRRGNYRDDSWKNDPGEQAADRWNETHGDRWIES